MKKSYFILLAIFLVISACDKHGEPVSDIPYDSYIFFDPDGAATRAGMLSGNRLPNATGTDFGVFGFRNSGTEVFSAYDNNVARLYRPTGSSDTNPKAFVYDELALWTAGEHTFYAYYPYYIAGNTVGVTGVSTSSDTHAITYTQPLSLETMVDVMTAHETASASDGAVQLKFEHRLFALDVVLHNCQSSYARPLTVTDASVVLKNVIKGGTLVIGGDSEPSKETVSISHTYVSESDLTIAAPAIGSESPVAYNFNEDNSFLFLPCETITLDFTIKFINTLNEQMEFSVNDMTISPEGGFRAGCKYDIIINKTDNENGVEFVPSLQLIYDANGNKWDSHPDINIEFN